MIDTHCHLNDRSAFPDPGQVLERAAAAGVHTFVVVGIDEPSSARALELAERFENVFATVGWHPSEADGFGQDQLHAARRLAANPKVVAIGEVGLDYHWEPFSKERQLACLEPQLDLAAELGLPCVLHCRKAYADLLELFERRPPQPAVFHCFSGDADDARRVQDLDCYIGVDGPITYPKAQALREIVTACPRDRVVIETDSPYLSPAPMRGARNSPENLRFVNSMLARLWGLEETETAELTARNARTLFNRLGPR